MNLELLRDSARSICRNDGKLTARARYDDEHIFGRRSVSRLVQLRARNRLQVSGIIQIMVGHSFHDRYCISDILPCEGEDRVCVCVCVCVSP